MLSLVVFPHSTDDADLPTEEDDLIARLAERAYQTALRHGLVASFIDAELEIWEEIRDLVQSEGGFGNHRLRDDLCERSFPRVAMGL